MKKTKTQKGITLIALIITIIVLLILAVVAIGAVQNDGIINHAKNAREEYQSAQANENATLEHYLDMLEGNAPNGSGTVSTLTMAQAQGKVVSANTKVKDAYGNELIVPAGFKITADASLVTEGIVIEDCTEAGTKGSQFVWIPVGTIYTDEAQTESKAKTITLGRYEFDDDDGSYYTSINTSYSEKQKGDATAQNAIAKDIEAFKTSATTNKGYYIGRYEAGVTNYNAESITTINNSKEVNWTGYQATDGKTLQLVCKSGETVWNYVTQRKASELSGNMYNASTFTSDLVNSYAWDTAIIFIQTFGTDSNSSKYSITGGDPLISATAPQKTGENQLKETNAIDEQLNIYDMAGNCIEWSTESIESEWYDCVTRGGFYDFGESKDRMRHYETCPHGSFGGELAAGSFRPVIYLAN